MNLSPLPIQKFFDNNGNPLVGGLLFTYTAGTSSKLATYVDSAGMLNTDPVVLDFRGEANVWLDQTLTYKFVLAPAGDTDPPTKPIWTVDNISAAITYASLTALIWPKTAQETAAGATIVNYLKEYYDVERYGANATPGTTDMTAALQVASAASALGGGNIIVRSLIRTTSNVTLAAGSTIEFKQGGQITVDAACTLTVNGNVRASRTKIFLGAGSVVYGGYLVDREAIAFPEWFGAVHDNSTDDTAALSASIAMVTPVYGAVSLSTGYYKTTTGLTFQTRVRMYGVNMVESVIAFTPSSNDLSAIGGAGGGTDNCELEHFGISGSGVATGKRGVSLTAAASAWRFRNMAFSGLNDWCILHDSAQHDIIEQCRFLNTHNATNSGVAILTSTFANRFSVNQNRFSNNDRDFKVNTAGTSISFCENSQESTGSLSGAPDCSVEFNNVLGFQIRDNYCEAIRTGTSKGVFEIAGCQGGDISVNYFAGDQGGISYSYRFVNCSGNTRYTRVNNNVFKEANVGVPILDKFIAAGNFTIEAHGNSYTRNGVAQTTYQASVVYLGTPGNIDLDLPFTFTYDPPSLADGAGTTNTVAVTGATFGDRILATAPYDLQGITVTAYVSSSGNCAVRLQNESGGVIDLASGTWQFFRQAGNL